MYTLLKNLYKVKIIDKIITIDKIINYKYQNECTYM
jgi:hypothetical protein